MHFVHLPRIAFLSNNLATFLRLPSCVCARFRADSVRSLLIHCFRFREEEDVGSSTGISDGYVIGGIERHVWAWAIGGVFAGLACCVSFRDIYHHFKYGHGHHWQLTKYIIRILLMVPIYSVEAWLGLIAKHYTAYYDLARECYEAFVIHALFQFLLHYLGGHEKIVVDSKDHHVHKHMIPCCCLKDWTNHDGQFVSRASLGAMQYVPIKLATAIVTFILTQVGKYHDGEFKLHDGYPYIAFITNASQIWAMYCLVMFLHAHEKALKDTRPVAKLLCVKAVVFFTFWQSVIVAGLVHIGYIERTRTYTVEEASRGLQDFIICIEMLLGALAHNYAFPSTEFRDGKGDEHPPVVSRSVFNRMASIVSPKDIYHGAKVASTPVAALAAISENGSSTGGHGAGHGEGGAGETGAADPAAVQVAVAADNAWGDAPADGSAAAPAADAGASATIAAPVVVELQAQPAHNVDTPLFHNDAAPVG